MTVETPVKDNALALTQHNVSELLSMMTGENGFVNVKFKLVRTVTGFCVGIMVTLGVIILKDFSERR